MSNDFEVLPPSPQIYEHFKKNMFEYELRKALQSQIYEQIQPAADLMVAIAGMMAACQGKEQSADLHNTISDAMKQLAEKRDALNPEMMSKTHLRERWMRVDSLLADARCQWEEADPDYPDEKQ